MDFTLRSTTKSYRSIFVVTDALFDFFFFFLGDEDPESNPEVVLLFILNRFPGTSLPLQYFLF